MSPQTFEIVDPISGTRVWLSAAGCPVRVQVAPTLLARGADAVAETVVTLCRQAPR